MKAFFIYTGLRIGLFALVASIFLGLAAAVGSLTSGTYLLVLLASALVSSVLSWKVLEGPREDFARTVQGRAERAAAKFEEMKSKEDVD